MTDQTPTPDAPVPDLPLPLEVSIIHDGTVHIMGRPDGDVDGDGRHVMIWPHVATMEDVSEAEEWAAAIVAAVNGREPALGRAKALETALADMIGPAARCLVGRNGHMWDGLRKVLQNANAVLGAPAALRAERDEAQPVAAAVHLHYAMDLLEKAAEFIDELPATDEINSDEWVWRHQYDVFLDPASAHPSFGEHGRPSDHAHPPATSPGAIDQAAVDRLAELHAEGERISADALAATSPGADPNALTPAERERVLAAFRRQRERDAATSPGAPVCKDCTDLVSHETPCAVPYDPPPEAASPGAAGDADDDLSDDEAAAWVNGLKTGLLATENDPARKRRIVSSIEPAPAAAEVDRVRVLEGLLREILDYTGGAESALDDEYLMGRACAAIEERS